MKNDNLVTFAEMIDRIKDVASKHTDGKVFDNDVAGLLRMSGMNLANAKRRNKPPLEQILRFCYRTGLDPMKILF